MGRDAKLDDQMAECRELLAEVRGATKDLHHEIVRAKATFTELAEERIERVVSEELDRVGVETAGFIRIAEERIQARFDGLTNLLLTGSRRGRPKRGDANLEEVIEKAAVRMHLEEAAEVINKWKAQGRE
jgi:hypothetical protein